MTDPTGRLERVAHRGAPRERRENTIPSFLRAIELGADAIELDVHRTSDGVAVVHHDEVVATATASVALAAATWREVAAIEPAGAAAGERVPRLDDVLDTVGDRARLYVELKGRGAEIAAIDAIRRHGRRYAVHSFDHDVIARVAATAPEIPRGVLLDRGTQTPVNALDAAVNRTRPRDVWPHWSIVDAEFMAEARRLGLRVIAWTVNSHASARALRDLGVDGVCTDDLTVLANI